MPLAQVRSFSPSFTSCSVFFLPSEATHLDGALVADFTERELADAHSLGRQAHCTRFGFAVACVTATHECRRVVEVVELLKSKKVERPWKKHANIPL